MKLNYKEKKLLSEEEKSQKDIEFAVDSTKLQLYADILTTKHGISEVENELREIKTTYPFDTEKYIEKVSELDGLKDGLNKLEELKKEFGFC